MRRRTRFLSPWWLAALALALLLQTGISQGKINRFNPPVKVPEFNLPGLDGQKHALSEYRGRPLVISVWASWCAPCKAELPEFARARRELAGPFPDAVFTTVNLGESGARAKTWMDKTGLGLPVWLATMKFMDDYGLMVVPAILVFDGEGRVVVLHQGWSNDTNLVEELGQDLASLARQTSF
jgi:cytochrome c biogenesis protein CcmG/thiol:disulfide interchange protein DsbE